MEKIANFQFLLWYNLFNVQAERNFLKSILHFGLMLWNKLWEY